MLGEQEFRTQNLEEKECWVEQMYNMINNKVFIFNKKFIDMGIDTLADKYFDQIRIEDTDFVPIDDAVSDAAYLLLNVPIKMLKEYLQLEGQNKKLPDGAEFWKETGLGKRLRNIEHSYTGGRVSLSDILDYIEEGDVWGDYQELNFSEKIRLSITEIPEFYDD